MHIFGTDISLNDNEAFDFRIENNLSFPTVSAADAGRIILHTGQTKFYGYDGNSWIHLGDQGGGGYTLPKASTTTLGGVKIDGTTITIDGDGVISGSSSYTLPAATDSTLGGVIVDNTTITVDGSGVITANYVDPAIKIFDEGNGDGFAPDFRINNPTFYGNIGTYAIDFSVSNGVSSTKGATGTYSFAQGNDVTSSGWASNAFGYDTTASGTLAFAAGYSVTVSGYSSFGMGIQNTVSGSYSFSQGSDNISSNFYSSTIGIGLRTTNTSQLSVGQSNVAHTPLGGINNAAHIMFAVGNGSIVAGTPNTRGTASDALLVRYSGEVTADSLTIALIDAESSGRVLTTREWIEAQGFGSGGGGSVAIEDEGVQVVAAASTLNFIGANVVASDAGSGQIDVTVSGGGAGNTITGYVSDYVVSEQKLYQGWESNGTPSIRRTDETGTVELAQSVTNLATDWPNRLSLTYV